MIRDLVFAETARTQFNALSKGRKGVVWKALLEITQTAERHGIWRSEGKHRLAVTYEVRPGTVRVTGIDGATAAPVGDSQPFYGVEMRRKAGGGWTQMNPHEE